MGSLTNRSMAAAMVLRVTSPYPSDAVLAACPHLDRTASNRVTVTEIARVALAFDAIARVGTRDQRRITAVLARLGWNQGAIGRAASMPGHDARGAYDAPPY